MLRIKVPHISINSHNLSGFLIQLDHPVITKFGLTIEHANGLIRSVNAISSLNSVKKYSRKVLIPATELVPININPKDEDIPVWFSVGHCIQIKIWHHTMLVKSIAIKISEASGIVTLNQEENVNVDELIEAILNEFVPEKKRKELSSDVPNAKKSRGILFTSFTTGTDAATESQVMPSEPVSTSSNQTVK